MKTTPITIKSLNNLEYHCYKGLNAQQLNYAKEQVAKIKQIGIAVPYGIIRKAALAEYFNQETTCLHRHTRLNSGIFGGKYCIECNEKVE